MNRWLLSLLLMVMITWPGLGHPRTPTTLQSGVTSNAAGTAFTVDGYAQVLLTVTISGTATVTFQQASSTQPNFYQGMTCTNTDTDVQSLYTTVSGTFVCSSSQSGTMLTPVSGCSSCTVTVTALGNSGKAIPLAAQTTINGASGASTFDQVGTGTNTTATMTLGSGSSLTYSGTGTVNANKIAGNAVTGISGNTGTVGTTSGTLTSGDCAKFDASGNIVDSGGACGGGANSFTVQALTTSGSISGTHKFITCDATAGAVVITLPAASAVSGADFQFKKIDSSANSCTVTRAGTDTIDGATTAALTTQYEAIGLAASSSSAWSVF